MGDLAAVLTSFNLGPANTILLAILFVVIKKKLCQHEVMYEWYLGQRAIEREELKHVETQSD